MPETFRKTDNEAKWWGWSLPHTRFVITSFDLLAMLLGPQERRWPPSQPYKIPGEIRPRTKTLQHTLRSVILYQGPDVQIQEIERLMHVVAAEIEPFLKSAAVRVIVDADEDEYVRGHATGRFYGAVGSTASRRRREGLHGEVKKWLLDEIKALDRKVGPTLVKIENILRPPKIIKLGGSPAVSAENAESKELKAGFAILVKGIFDAVRDLWDNILGIALSLFRLPWKAKRATSFRN